MRSDLKALLTEYCVLFRGVGLIADKEFKFNLKPNTVILRLTELAGSQKEDETPSEEEIEQKQF